MQCPNCSHKNPEEVNFCGTGGTQLRYLCPSCKTDNPLTNQFCHQCGQSLKKDEKVKAKGESRDSLSPLLVPLLASLLSIPLPDDYPSLNLSPQKQRQKTMEVLLAWLFEEAERQPVLFVVEDLHWIDPSTLELLGLLIDQGPTSRILTLLTFRPDFSPPWPIRSYLTHILLGRLSRKQMEARIEKVAKGKALPAEVLEQVVTRTDGIPLFGEELTKMVLELGLLREEEDHYELTGPLPSLAILTTLQDSLMARLDRLATVKEVAQLGALLGQEFSYESLQTLKDWLPIRPGGARLSISYFLARLAETYGKVKRVEEGLALLDEVLTGVDKTGDHRWEAELYRIKGELLRQKAKGKNGRGG